MWGRTSVVILCVVAVTASDTDEWWEVNIAQGPVRGRLDTTGQVYTFYSIPYATAPTGENKFKAPLPAPTWTEPYDAIDKVIVCPQFLLKPFMPEDINMQEDCLIANVYVPDTKGKDLPVLVYVHGGAFQVGLGDWLKPKHLMQKKDIIVVNFNYRLGIHGFLCLGTEDVPGNAGMKDQVALLRWVQNNIAAFGGNPNDVTIAGYSAGSASVDLLMISKTAQGLFHKVIPESGSNMAAFTVQSNPLKTAKNHAMTLNFTNIDDIYALEAFYKTLSFDILTSSNILDIETDLFTPCIERDICGEPFLLESPINILQRRDYKTLPMLYGFANMEGLLRIASFDTSISDMNEKFSNFLPKNLKFKNEEEKEQVAKQVKKFYFGNEPVSEGNVLKYVEYFSDIFFVHSTLWSLKLYTEGGHDKIYLYEYSFVDEDTPFVPYTKVRGATHCAQTMAVLDGKNLTDSKEDNLTTEYREMKNIVRGIWHNFVKTGEPIGKGSSLPAWPAVGVDGSPYMSLGQNIELRGKLSEERFRFWDNIYQKHYLEPIPPPPPRSHIEL